jgi:hypothetical protein
MEWLVAQAPRVILDASRDAEPAGSYWARWPSLPAVADGRVVDLPPGVATLPGPRLDVALRVLARAVHGPAILEEAGPGAAGGADPGAHATEAAGPEGAAAVSVP